jgi:hypothetical protein
MLRSLIATLFVAVVQGAAAAGPSACVTFDINWNMLALGFGEKDYNLGTQANWASSGSLTDITTQGRPPFNSVNTTCYLSQFTNAIYVMNADSKNPSSIYIYDATAKSWSTQTTTTGKFDPSNFAAILDHDTNVFYSYSNGELYALDMSLLKAANSSALPWVDVQQADLSADTSGVATPGAGIAGYQPVMALAQNHIHFLGISDLPAGSAKIFVIHFSFMQLKPQSYGSFPSTHGGAASFFLNEGVQQEFAFVPDDGSSTYVINVETNTTKTLSGPPQADPFATYSASTSALVQVTSDGKVAFLPYNPNTTTSGGTWTSIPKLTSLFGTSNSSSGTSSGTSSGNSSTTKSSGSSPSKASSQATTTAGTKSSAASPFGTRNVLGMAIAFGLAAVGVLAM